MDYPDAGFSGTDTFTYTAKGSVGYSNVATVTITVIASTATVLVDDTYTVPTNGSLIVAAPGVLANDINPGDYGVAQATQPMLGM